MDYKDNDFIVNFWGVIAVNYFMQLLNAATDNLESETRSSFISARDWDLSSKFGMQIGLHLLKWVQQWT